ncbi:hypothetical protein KR009_002071 [Drosophila setifemur]|nr:hypothetical protein KR009_002071 [Drosophila setifemur]
MNCLHVCIVLLLGLTLTQVDAQQATRSPDDKRKDDICGPARYYNNARHTCLPW